MGGRTSALPMPAWREGNRSKMVKPSENDNGKAAHLERHIVQVLLDQRASRQAAWQDPRHRGGGDAHQPPDRYP
eukprot:682946-Alexandrium_andersonii.AAC.1